MALVGVPVVPRNKESRAQETSKRDQRCGEAKGHPLTLLLLPVLLYCVAWLFPVRTNRFKARD